MNGTISKHAKTRKSCSLFVTSCFTPAEQQRGQENRSRHAQRTLWQHDEIMGIHPHMAAPRPESHVRIRPDVSGRFISEVPAVGFKRALILLPETFILPASTRGRAVMQRLAEDGAAQVVQ